MRLLSLKWSFDCFQLSTDCLPERFLAMLHICSRDTSAERREAFTDGEIHCQARG